MNDEIQEITAIPPPFKLTDNFYYKNPDDSVVGPFNYYECVMIMNQISKYNEFLSAIKYIRREER